MLSFRDFLIENENRIKFVVGRYAGKLDEPTIRRLAEADPTHSKLYTEWIVKLVVNMGPRQWSLMEPQWDNHYKNLFREKLTTYERIKPLVIGSFRDINRFKHWNDFSRFISDYGHLKSEKEKKREEEQVARNETTMIYKGSSIMVVSPKTERSAKFWGRGTKWCTSAERSNMFEVYNRQGPLFILIGKDGRKFQWHNKTNSLADEKDDMLTESDSYLFKRYGQDMEKLAAQLADKTSPSIARILFADTKW